MIGIVRQRALGIAGMTMPRIVIAVRTTARIESGIGAAETTATQGVVAETLHRIAAATSRRELSITRSARRLRGTRRAVKTSRKDAANSLPRWKKVENEVQFSCSTDFCPARDLQYLIQVFKKYKSRGRIRALRYSLPPDQGGWRFFGCALVCGRLCACDIEHKTACWAST